MPTAGRPWWQQVTALVSVSVGGAVTGLSFVPQTPADLTSPASIPVRLLAAQVPAQPARQVPGDDAALRAAIVNVARYYLRLAERKTPAQMESIIWQHTSLDGADHGPSCAAFASLTLELGAQAVGARSWVSGGSSYPWPLPKWADVRVQPNPASPGIVSVLQDAQAHHRWHPLGGGYRALPGDWVVFGGHVEVVTGYAHGVLHTVGADSLPDFSVNAHTYRDPLGSQGVLGFVSNGTLASAPAPPAGHDGPALAQRPGRARANAGTRHPGAAARRRPHIPAPRHPAARPGGPAGGASVPGTVPSQPAGTAAATPAPYLRHAPAELPPSAAGTADQEAFIRKVAPGAIAAQRRYGIPASVTIAQAIDESGWGMSTLATRDHNLFGIKGTGPAGTARLPTREYVSGRLVTRTARFRVYHDAAESISDHSRLLATSGRYRQAMAHRDDPDAFAAALSGVYATDPGYGSKLVALMRHYDLYRFDTAASPGRPAPPARPRAAERSTPQAPAPIPGLAPVPGQRVPRPAPRPHRNLHQPAGGAAIPGQPPATVPSTLRPAASTSPHQPPAAAHAAIPGQPAAAPGSIHRHPAPATGEAAVPGSSPLPGWAAPGGAGAASAAGTGPGTAVPGYEAATPGWAAAPGGSPGIPGDAARAGGAAVPGPPAMPAARTAGAVVRGANGVAAAGAPHDAILATSAGSEVPVSVPVRRQAGPGMPTRGQAGRGQLSRGQAGPGQAGRGAWHAAPAAASPPRRYQPQIPPSVRTAFTAQARVPLLREEPLYRDIASETGIRWELLAACDWMQCRAHPRHSPVHGEKLGSINPDGTVYRTKSEALAQCAEDLVRLSDAVYQIDLTAPGALSVRELASVFAAFRWGGLLRAHRTSAMEFPYSVAGLTAQHLSMRWPRIDEPHAPDKPGSRFRMPFGAVPIVLCLNYPATVLFLPRKEGDLMIRMLLLLAGALRVSGPARRLPAAWQAAPGGRAPRPVTCQAPGQATFQGTCRAADQASFQQPPDGCPPGPQPAAGAGAGQARWPAAHGWPGAPAGRGPGRRWRIARWALWGTATVAAVLVFRRMIASLVLAALAAGLHLIGVNAHLPSVRFAWPWQSAQAGTATATGPGPWVLQKIQGISRPALGQASFDFVFTRRMSQNIGPWPCWYASTFYAVGHASATVDLNPGPAWWAPARGHYRLRVLSRPQAGKPGHVAVTMTLPQPQLPRSAHDVSIDDIPSRPLATQHSWTYPGLGCGVVLHPQFPQSVLYAQAQRIAFYKATHSPQVTHALIAAAQAQAAQTIRANFIQPTVNAFGYTLDRLTLRWLSPGA